MFDQGKFDNWQHLRKEFKEAKREKNFESVVKIAKEIIDLDKKAKFIGIMAPLFHKELGAAYQKLGDNSLALKHFNEAKTGLVKYRKTEQLSSPDDWLRDIETLEKKIAKLT